MKKTYCCLCTLDVKQKKSEIPETKRIYVHIKHSQYSIAKMISYLPKISEKWKSTLAVRENVKVKWKLVKRKCMNKGELSPLKETDTTGKWINSYKESLKSESQLLPFGEIWKWNEDGNNEINEWTGIIVTQGNWYKKKELKYCLHKIITQTEEHYL